jgi:hypothetical protein
MAWEGVVRVVKTLPIIANTRPASHPDRSVKPYEYGQLFQPANKDSLA